MVICWGHAVFYNMILTGFWVVLHGWGSYIQGKIQYNRAKDSCTHGIELNLVEFWLRWCFRVEQFEKSFQTNRLRKTKGGFEDPEGSSAGLDFWAQIWSRISMLPAHSNSLRSLEDGLACCHTKYVYLSIILSGSNKTEIESTVLKFHEIKKCTWIWKNVHDFF